MLPVEDMPDIQIRRSSRGASYIVSSPHKEPETAAMVRCRSSSRVSFGTDPRRSIDLDETDNLIDWDDNSEDGVNVVIELANIKFKCQGKDFNELKPLKDSGLYYHVVCNYHNNEIRVREWINSYKDGLKLESICEILQLFVDVMGFQNVNVQDIYKDLQNAKFNSKVHPVVEYINNIKNKPAARHFLLTSPKQWSKGVRNTFHACFDKLVAACYTEKVLLDPITIQINYFLKHAMKSPSLVSSTLIMVFMMNTFVDLIVSIKKRYGNNYTSKTLTWMSKMVVYYFHQITAADIVTCSLKDKRFLPIRIDVIRFLKYWIEEMPSLFLSEDATYDLLKKLLVDKKDLVRREAMKCCIKILTVEREHINMDNFKLLLTVIINRVQDCDLSVASMAIKCHTKSIERFSTLIRENFKIPSRVAAYSMLAKQFIIRKQALINLCATIKLLHIPPAGFILKIAETVHMLNNNEKYTFMLFLIEAAYECVPELSNLELISEVMLCDLEIREYSHYLLEIFCNSVKMQYLGYLEEIDIYGRDGRETPDFDVKRRVTNIVLNDLVGILEKFDEYHVKCLFETLNIFSIQDLKASENHEIIVHLPKLLIKYFKIYTNGEVLDEIIKFFANCMTSSGVVKRSFLTNVSELCTFVTNFPKCYVYDTSTDANVQMYVQTARNEQLLERLNSLIKNINFMKYSRLSWNDIYVDWFNSKISCITKISTLQIQCCQHYLTCHLKQIIDNEYDDESVKSEMDDIKKNTNQYIKTLISLLKSKGVKANLQNSAFECLCDIHLDFKRVIDTVPTGQYEQIHEEFALEKLSDHITDLLCTFVANKMEAALKAMKASNEIDVDLDRNRICVHFLLRMFRCGFINLSYDHSIFRFFNNELFELYGNLFTKYLDCIIKDTQDMDLHAVEYTMYRTLKTVFFTAHKDTLPSIINQFGTYLSNRRLSSTALIILVINFVEMKQTSETVSGLLTLIQPLLDKVPKQDMKDVVKKCDGNMYQNTNDPNIKNFHLKVLSYRSAD